MFDFHLAFALEWLLSKRPKFGKKHFFCLFINVSVALYKISIYAEARKNLSLFTLNPDLQRQFVFEPGSPRSEALFERFATSPPRNAGEAYSVQFLL